MKHISYFENTADAEMMALDYLKSYFLDRKFIFPINPFELLKFEGIIFKMVDFDKLEGVYIPASIPEDFPTVGINANRPITRQRFTAAHELCHHLKDSKSQIACPINGKKNEIEIFAERFAAALLMPLPELKVQVDKRRNSCGYISLDDVLEISMYFGVSFESCLYRIAYKTFAIEGETTPKAIKKLISQYKPDNVRKERHLSYEKLYADLLDNYSEQLSFVPRNSTRLIFQNEYIYNDSRMEGLKVTIEQASEIVTDLRLNTQNSEYCNEGNEVYMSIAGHYEMYNSVFDISTKDISVFDTFNLNRKLFSHYPHPEYGGHLRDNNTLVVGAKFETTDYHDILSSLLTLESEIKDVNENKATMSTSEYIRHVAKTHHRLTVIHPFSDGNGRTARAFMNMQLLRNNLPPVYILVKDKKNYLKALEIADKEKDFNPLYELFFRLILLYHVYLTKE